MTNRRTAAQEAITLHWQPENEKLTAQIAALESRLAGKGTEVEALLAEPVSLKENNADLIARLGIALAAAVEREQALRADKERIIGDFDATSDYADAMKSERDAALARAQAAEGIADGLAQSYERVDKRSRIFEKGFKAVYRTLTERTVLTDNYNEDFRAALALLDAEKPREGGK